MTYLQPLVFAAIILLAAGILRLRRSRGKHAALVIGGWIFLLAAAWPPVAWLFAQTLEAGYAPGPPPAGVQAFVVIASSAEFARPEQPFDMLGQDTYRRCLHAAWLYRNLGRRPVLVSGRLIAPAMRRVLTVEGVAPHDIYEEAAAANTHANAVYSAAILARHKISVIALIGEARDLPRAERCFRKAGLTVHPYPILITRLRWEPAELLPDWRAIRSNEHTLHELLGLAWYRVRGWI